MNKQVKKKMHKKMHQLIEEHVKVNNPLGSIRRERRNKRRPAWMGDYILMKPFFSK